MYVSQYLRVRARLYMFTFVAFIFTLVIHNSLLFFSLFFLHVSCLRITHFEFDPQRERERGWGAGRQADRQTE